MENTEGKIKQLEEEISSLKAQIKDTAVFQAEKDRLEDEYQRSQQRFRTIFERSAIGKKIIDDQLRIIKVNQALLKIWVILKMKC